MLIWTVYCGFTLSELLTPMKPDAEKHADLLIWFAALKTSGLYVSYIKKTKAAALEFVLLVLFTSLLMNLCPPDV